MRLGPAIHGALLALILVFAYKTWTRDTSEKPKAGEVTVWTESADAFESLVFKDDTKEVKIERRADADGTYLWGTVSRTRVTKKQIGPHTVPDDDGHGHGGPMDDLGAPDPHGAAPDPHGAAPGPAKPDAAKPDAAKAKPDAAKPDAAKPDAAKPDAVKAKAKADAPKPIKAEPTPAKPEPAKPTGDGAKAGQNDPIPAAAPAAGGPPPTDATDTADMSPAPFSQPAPAPPMEETETTVKQFPVGEDGDNLLKSFSSLRALRSLGTPTDDQKIEYGLDETKESIVITFKGGTVRKLLVGDRAFGSSDRYVLEEASGKGYVLSSDIMKYIDSAETALALKSYNKFDLAKDLFQISVDANGANQTLVRLEVEDAAKEGDDEKKKRTTWAKKEAPTVEDVTMANFIDRASKLRPIDFLPDLKPESLTLIARFEYGGKDGKPIGYLDFYKGADPSSPTGAEEYFMRTEKTRVVGKVSKLTAERVDQDLSEVFGAAPTPETPPPPGDAPMPAPTE